MKDVELSLRRWIVVLSLMLAGLGPGSLLGQQKKASHGLPSVFKVLSHDGSESLTARCQPVGGRPTAIELSCDFVHVRFQEPSVDGELTSMIEEVRKVKTIGQQPGTGVTAPNPKLAKELDHIRTYLCHPEVLRQGPGRKAQDYLRQLLAACEAKDTATVLQLLADHQQRTCALWVDRFSLEFAKVNSGQWIYRQDRPGLSSRVLKVYELTGEDYSWTLTETRVPTEGSDEKPIRTVWSSRNSLEHEPRCEFISHQLLQAP